MAFVDSLVAREFRSAECVVTMEGQVKEDDRHPTGRSPSSAAVLRACTTAATDLGTDGDDTAAAEEKFEQTKQLLERLEGRVGFEDLDKKWRRLVTDVRNGHTFVAKEVDRDTNAEYETYSESSGKSGGQKEKLAYTILGVSLVSQYKILVGSPRSDAFRFAVIDEAFGRGSESSTRSGLELFERLGLQLLVVTPL